MSTLKVNAIESQAANSAPTIAGVQYPTAGALSNRNIVINGAMQVGQRANVANETAPKYGKVDRFHASVGGSTNKNYNFSQVVGCVPQEGFEFGLEYENINSVTPAADDFVIVNQPIEGLNVQSIRKGTTKALPVTLSFFARCSRTGTYIVELFDLDNQRSVSQAYSLVSGEWKHVVLTFPADTTGALDNDNGHSFNISWWLGAGSNFTGGGSLNTVWQNFVNNQRAVGLESSFMTTAGSTFNLTGVQLEVGNKATPFEHRSFSDDLARCQRYFSKSYAQGVDPGTNTSVSCHSLRNWDNAHGRSSVPVNTRWPVTMRATPSITFFNLQGTADAISEGNNADTHTNSRTVSATKGAGMGGVAGVDTSVNVAASQFYNWHYTASAEIT